MLKDGRKVRITIGDPSHYGIDDARTKAGELQKLINDGLDPREVKAEKIASGC
jgi:hypothetical protein